MKTNLLWALALMAFFSAANLAWAYYDPGVQRWLNRDPLGDTGSAFLPRHQALHGLKGPAESLLGPNLCAFIHNSPVSLFDIDGRRPPTDLSFPPGYFGEGGNPCKGACPETCSKTACMVCCVVLGTAGNQLCAKIPNPWLKAACALAVNLGSLACGMSCSSCPNP